MIETLKLCKQCNCYYNPKTEYDNCPHENMRTGKITYKQIIYQVGALGVDE